MRSLAFRLSKLWSKFVSSGDVSFGMLKVKTISGHHLNKSYIYFNKDRRDHVWLKIRMNPLSQTIYFSLVQHNLLLCWYPSQIHSKHSRFYANIECFSQNQSTKIFILVIIYINLLWCQFWVFLIELFELLWCLSLKWCLASQTLEDNSSNTPQICFGIILKRHDHLRSLQTE